VEYVSEERTWLNRDNWVSISGVPSPNARKTSQVTHSVLVVSDDIVRNITGAVPASPSSDGFRPGDADEGTDDAVPEIDPALAQSERPENCASLSDPCLEYSQTPSPFNPLALETIAMIFATDVPSIALLVIPSSSPVQRAIFELRNVGVNARELDFLKDRPLGRDAIRSNPILIVSTWANTRGLDVGELSHVFVLGIPGGGTTAYVHIAGRVGRLESGRRRKGKVVMVVSPGEEEAARNLLKTVNHEPVEFAV
jgi:superfamily II DNA/RNA helicase